MLCVTTTVLMGTQRAAARPDDELRCRFTAEAVAAPQPSQLSEQSSGFCDAHPRQAVAMAMEAPAEALTVTMGSAAAGAEALGMNLTVAGLVRDRLRSRERRKTLLSVQMVGLLCSLETVMRHDVSTVYLLCCYIY